MTMREWKQKIQRDMERSWGETFYGIAIPCKKTHADGGMVQSEKVLKFNKKAMRDCNETDWKREDKLRREKTYAKLVAHYHNQYNIENEISPFDGEE
jgi:hypothetical protein